MSGEAQTPISKDHPLSIAWEAYKQTNAYANSRHWALHRDAAEHGYVDGSLWAAFEQGWRLALGDAGEAARTTQPADLVLAQIRAQYNINHVCAAYLRTVADTIERGEYVTDANEAAVVAAMEPEAPRAVPAHVSKLVDQQANDAGLWFIATTAPEAYLQQELRRLHAAIEALPAPRLEGWQPIESAPKGSGVDGPQDVRDPNYVAPPHVWLTLEDGQRCVGYWDWYYAEGGNGYDGGSAWVEEFSGERVTPTQWMPLPAPPSGPREA